MNTTCKLPIVGSENICILNTEWSEEQVHLLLLHDNKAWTGKFQIEGNEDIPELLEKLSMSEEQYLKEVKTALTTHGGAEHYAYSIENEKFTWKKLIKKNMAVKFGYVTVSMLPVFNVFEKIIDKVLESHMEISDQLATISNEKQALKEDNTNLKTKLNDLIVEKSQMEATVYSQFLGLLNEKKKMIQKLKQKIEPGDCHSDESDSQLSDNDHFGSETEIDSEEEAHIPNKVEIVEGKSSLELEDKIIFMLPKRTRQTTKCELPAGPSGMNNLLNQSSSEDSATTKNKSANLRVRKSRKNDCVVKTVSKNEGNDNHEEDFFMFPKRLKSKISENTQTASKICYESDDETDINNVVKQEPESDSDSTPNELNVAQENISPTAKHVESKEMNSCREMNNKLKNESIDNPNKESQVKNAKGFKKISSCVSDVLDQLV